MEGPALERPVPANTIMPMPTITAIRTAAARAVEPW